MPFIGNQPALSYTSFAKQDFTTSATTSYTLDHPVTNENEIALFINFVRQEPTTAYTASGTTLTLTSATSATDDMYCVFLGKAVQTVNPPNSSVGTSQLDSSLDFSSKTITLADNMKSTPAFEATISADSSFSRDTVTKINFNTETFDTDSAYDNSTNYRFTVPSGDAGKYYIYLTLGLKSGASSNFEYAGIYLYKNGSQERVVWIDLRAGDGRDIPLNLITTLDLSVGDYLEPYVYVVTSSGDPDIMAVRGSTKLSVFGAYKLIGV